MHPSPNFLSPASFLESHIASKKKPFMAKFYEAQRKRMNLLIEEDGMPTGGKWSFDTENRAKLPKHHVPPMEPRVSGNAFTREAADYVSKHFPENSGSLKHFRWPVTRKDAEAWLDRFIGERLEHYGLYEDAISTKHTTIYHTTITPMLNIGLLDPRDVVRRVLAKDTPMNSKEGFHPPDHRLARVHAWHLPAPRHGDPQREFLELRPPASPFVLRWNDNHPSRDKSEKNRPVHPNWKIGQLSHSNPYRALAFRAPMVGCGRGKMMLC